MIDLDLDVRRRRTGAIELLDEDEFAEHQVKYSYPAESSPRRRAAPTGCFGAVTQRTEPFGHKYLEWLELVQ